jgi:hypothetical protein
MTDFRLPNADCGLKKLKSQILNLKSELFEMQMLGGFNGFA